MTSPRILVVDDQRNWREVMHSLFTDSGYNVDTADSVDSAWKLLREETFALAILDVRLVDKDPYDVQGVELLEQMKERLEDSFPVVIMTGYSFEGLEQILRDEYGVRAFVNKGTLEDARDFKSLVASILGS
ncbi:MAG: response regulator [Candidatus Lokiarchaeota archaeon]|nr:response regulator [Candidatus Lokiarchaeota archaeon]